MAPKDEAELQRMLITSINHKGPTALRIPRGSGLGVAVMDEGWEPLNIGEGEIGRAKVISQKMIRGRCEARLELKQGKKREVRRIFRSLKIKLFSLHRVSFGSINIGSLKIGESRFLKENEVKNLKNKF